MVTYTCDRCNELIEGPGMKRIELHECLPVLDLCYGCYDEFIERLGDCLADFIVEEP